MTLLHTLIWANRPDLAKLIVEVPTFKKINFKFNIPVGMAPMYASALDLAIGMWLDKSTAINLEFIELLLKHGAVPPNPVKKFLNEEFTSIFYPHIMKLDEEQSRSHEELIKLFCLLHRYGFSVPDMESNLNTRLFDTSESANNRSQEFAENFKVSVEEQKVKFDAFINSLREQVQLHSVDKLLVVSIDEAMLDNGRDTLRLPFDPTDRACCIM